MAHISKADFDNLNDALPSGEVYQHGTMAWQAAISIGNLLYRMIKPLAVVVVKTVGEVQTVVKFCKDRKIKLAIKNGGHSYAAYCLSDGGIVLDLSALNKVSVRHDEDKQWTATLQAGAIWKDVYHKLSEIDPGLLAIGGQCPTVGVSGFTLGGGLSPFSRSYGLGVDALVEMTIVTADGDLVTVGPNDSDEAKRDLFWAVRGGGGGNFGVTVGMKTQLQHLNDSDGTVICGNLSWKLAVQRNRDNFLDMMEMFNSQTWPKELAVDALWHSDNGHDLVGDMTILYNGTMGKCLEAIAPFLPFAPDINIREMKWMDWVQQEMQTGFGIKSQVYHHHASFVFGHGAITSEVVHKVLKFLEEAKRVMKEDPSKANVHFLWDHIGAKTAIPAPTDTAFYWRKGDYAANIKLSWTHPSLTEKMLKLEKDFREVISTHTLDGQAAYLNYIDDRLPNWQQAYYGGNYERLVKIKNRWDPDNFWRFDQSIGTSKGQPITIAARKISNGVMNVREGPVTASDSATAETEVNERWMAFSVKNPKLIHEAKDDDESVYQANLATRLMQGAL